MILAVPLCVKDVVVVIESRSDDEENQGSMEMMRKYHLVEEVAAGEVRFGSRLKANQTASTTGPVEMCLRACESVA